MFLFVGITLVILNISMTFYITMFDCESTMQYEMQHNKEFTMSTFKKIQSTGSKIKEVSLAVILAASLLGVTLSSNANAAENNVSTEVSEFIVTQGQVMLSELNTQLQQSIDRQIQAVAVNYSLDNTATWWATEQTVTQGDLSSVSEVIMNNSKTGVQK